MGRRGGRRLAAGHRVNGRQLPGGTALTTTYNTRGLPTGNAGALTRTYTFDAARQLTRVDHAATTPSTNHETFTYDGAGRRLDHVVKSGTATKYEHADVQHRGPRRRPGAERPRQRELSQ